jgi:hypothetical protein
MGSGLLFIIGILVSSNSFGQDAGIQTGATSLGNEARPLFSIALATANFTYSEKKMKDETMLYGVAARWAVPAERNFVLKAELDILTGNGEYDGQTQGGTPLTTGTENELFLVKGLAGVRNELGDNQVVTPFAGLAIRNLANRIEGSAGYRRDIRYFYLPFGVDWVIRPSGSFSAGLTAELDVLVSGNVKSHLSDASSQLPDIENHQSSGTGYRLAGHIKWHLDRVALSLEPYIQGWKVADSDRQPLGGSGLYVYEPENKSTMVGANAAFTF